MSDLDLSKFCAGADDSRVEIRKPFSAGAFTYATTGHIAVRVPRRADAVEWSGKRNYPEMLDKTFEPASTLEFVAVESLALPVAAETAKTVRCDMCGGSGKEHECPDCDCACPDCDGKGAVTEIAQISVGIFGLTFRLPFLQAILALPGLKRAVHQPAEGHPALFQFDGGVAALMPMLAPHRTHITLETSPTSESSKTTIETTG